MNSLLQIEKPQNTILVGPGLVGKSYCSDKILAFLPEVPMVNLGEYFRRLRPKDAAFDAEFGPVMDAGDLLPDEVVIPHTFNLLRQNLQAILIATDGICRTKRQVLETAEAGFLDEHDTVLILDAKDEVLMTRHADRLAKKSRADDGKFFERLGIYRRNEPHVLEALQTVGVQVIRIDGNEPLEMIGNKVTSHIRHTLHAERSRRRC